MLKLNYFSKIISTHFIFYKNIKNSTNRSIFNENRSILYKKINMCKNEKTSNKKNFNSNDFKLWIYKNYIINNSNIKLDLDNFISESFLTCEKILKIKEIYGISIDSNEIKIEEFPKQFRSFNNGFGYNNKDIFSFFNSICLPSIPKIENSKNFQKNICPDIFKQQSNSQNMIVGIISKKIGTSYLTFLEIDLKNNRISINSLFSSQTISFTFFYLNKNHCNNVYLKRGKFYENYKKNSIVLPIWMKIKSNLINYGLNFKDLLSKKNNQKITKDSFLSSSIKFISKEDYFKLFKKLASRWNYPMCMVHFTCLLEFQLDIIIYFPRYFESNFFNNQYSLFNFKYSFGNENNRFNFFLEKITPTWLSFGLGSFKIRRDFYKKISKKGISEVQELRIKNEISKKVIELLSNFSLGNSKFYSYFWIIYNNRLKINLINNKFLLKDFFHLLRFFSTKSNTSLISVEDYVLNMKINQKEIFYYVIKNNIFSRNDPNLEIIIKSDIEVLLLFDNHDEMIFKFLEEISPLWEKKDIFFKKVGSQEYCGKYLNHKNNKLMDTWKPIICLNWFVDELPTKFFKIENSVNSYKSSSKLILQRNIQILENNSLSIILGNLKKKNLYSIKKQGIIFEINGSNNLIRIFNKYLRNKSTKKVSKEIGILIWENSQNRCGIFLMDEWVFSKRIENILTLVLLILYSNEHKI